MIVLGIDHELQCHDRRLKALIVELVQRERVTMIAEENRPLSNTIGRQVSESLTLPWIEIDMSIEDRIKATSCPCSIMASSAASGFRSQFRLVHLPVEPLEALAARNEFGFRDFHRHGVLTALILCACSPHEPSPRYLPLIAPADSKTATNS